MIKRWVCLDVKFQRKRVTKPALYPGPPPDRRADFTLTFRCNCPANAPQVASTQDRSIKPLCRLCQFMVE